VPRVRGARVGGRGGGLSSRRSRQGRTTSPLLTSTCRSFCTQTTQRYTTKSAYVKPNSGGMLRPWSSVKAAEPAKAKPLFWVEPTEPLGPQV